MSGVKAKGRECTCSALNKRAVREYNDVEDLVLDLLNKPWATKGQFHKPGHGTFVTQSQIVSEGGSGPHSPVRPAQRRTGCTGLTHAAVYLPSSHPSQK